MTGVIEGLTISEENVRKNLAILDGIPMAESVMVELTRRGMSRQDAHEAVREASMVAYRTRGDLAAILSRNPDIKRLLSREDLTGLMDPARYTGTAPEQVDRVIARLSGYLKGKDSRRKTIRRKR
jgi:adenylosuccinate lyase